MHEQTEMANERDQSARAVMMRTVYYIAKASKPNSDFGNLIELQAPNGCPDLDNVGPYHHHPVVTEMEQCIADVISKDIKQSIHASPFVSLLIDETVNVTIHKKLIVFIRYADENGCAKTVFKGNYTATAGDAETIYNKFVEICDDLGLDPRRIIGFGLDGASVMLGKKTGVGVRLKVRSPHLTHVHCVAHRVNLAASGAAKVENVDDDYRKTVNAVFKVFKYSTARYQRLRELHAAMEPDDFQSLKEPCAVRWLSFTKAAISVAVCIITRKRLWAD